MGFTKELYLLLLACFFQACGQIGNHHHKKAEKMNKSLIQNENVKKAIDAWQNADKELWLSLFSKNPQLFDDGQPRDFMEFSTEAMGNERFLSIDKVEHNGTYIYGSFHSDRWGDFKTYFKFHLDPDGKIYQLDIGQAED